jgi:hypothetical protein
LSVILLLFKEKLLFKSHFIQSNHRVLRKNIVYTYGAPVLYLSIAMTETRGERLFEIEKIMFETEGES